MLTFITLYLLVAVTVKTKRGEQFSRIREQIFGLSESSEMAEYEEGDEKASYSAVVQGVVIRAHGVEIQCRESIDSDLKVCSEKFLLVLYSSMMRLRHVWEQSVGLLGGFVADTFLGRYLINAIFVTLQTTLSYSLSLFFGYSNETNYIRTCNVLFDLLLKVFGLSRSSETAEYDERDEKAPYLAVVQGSCERIRAHGVEFQCRESISSDLKVCEEKFLLVLYSSVMRLLYVWEQSVCLLGGFVADTFLGWFLINAIFVALQTTVNTLAAEKLY
ncbi:NRT1/ PTR family 6.3-like protein [Tanacetum coccineum]